MASCTKYQKRFLKAVEYRGVSVPKDLMDVIAKRASSDRQLDKILLSMLEVLEPPFCQKSHCPHHTTYGFAGCSKSIVPGKCPINLEYLGRKREKEKKFKSEVIEYMVSKGCDAEHAEMYFQAGPRRFGSMDRFKKEFLKEKEANND